MCHSYDILKATHRPHIVVRGLFYRHRVYKNNISLALSSLNLQKSPSFSEKKKRKTIRGSLGPTSGASWWQAYVFDPRGDLYAFY